jgi:hypothetical protein
MFLKSIDDYLGPGETRFFSRGYQRVTYETGEVVVDPGQTRVSATATLRYPADWSRKAVGTDLVPHLSTVDSLVLGVQLAEAYLAHGLGLDARARRSARLRRVRLQAGTTPQEDLAAVPLRADLRGTEPLPGAPGRSVSVFDCRAGVMRARCTVEHASPTAEPGPEEAVPASLDDLLGPAAGRLYGTGFQHTRHGIYDVRVDPATLRADASARFTAAAHTPDGIDGDVQPSLSPVDSFVTVLQLAQVLMYELDSIERGRSNTLWMLQTVLDAGEPSPLDGPLPAFAAVTGKHLLPLRGSRWRNVDLTGGCGGIRLRSTFAHELPAETRLAAA